MEKGSVMRSGAEFSPCQKYRYTLYRWWSEEKDATFVMLNPSTADEIDNDPTVERCQRRAKEMGFGGLKVVNIFAYRSTDPEALYDLDDPIGPMNDQKIVEATENAGIVICGWGDHGGLRDRGQQVLELLKSKGIVLHCLEVNLSGEPRHPLYIPYSTLPKILEKT